MTMHGLGGGTAVAISSTPVTGGRSQSSVRPVRVVDKARCVAANELRAKARALMGSHRAASLINAAINEYLLNTGAVIEDEHVATVGTDGAGVTSR